MKRNLTVLLTLAMLSLASHGFAQVLYWDGTASNITTNGDGISQGAAGAWNASVQNWDQGNALPHIAWTSGADAYFGATGIAAGSGLVTVGAPLTVNSITFGSTNYVISDGGNAANNLTLSSATNNFTATVGANVVNATTFNTYGIGTLVLTNVSSGLSAALNLNGGTLQLGDAANNNGPTAWTSAAVGSGATLLIRNASSTTYAQAISGPGSVYLNGKSSSVTTTLAGANTYTNKTIINQVTLSVANVDENDPNCNLGTGPLQIGNGASLTVLSYAFPGGDVTTTRPLIFGGTSSATINNISSGTLTLAGPISFAANSTAAKAITLGGNMPSVFASSIPDNITLTTTNVTRITKVNSGTWSLTASNSFSGGVSFGGGNATGILLITNDYALGAPAGTITFTTNGSTAASSGEIDSGSFPVTLGATRTITYTGPNAGGAPTARFKTTDINSLTIASYITGIGHVNRASSSSSLMGPVRFINETNNFAGNFSMGYGAVEFTALSNGGLPSSLGAASTAYTIANSSSAANFRYIGANNSSTTRAIDWTGTSGGLTLDASGGGTIQYLATGNLKSGLGSSGLTLTGTNTGANTLAQVINDSSGTTTLTKSGTGKWVLTAANTYSGATTITGGNLSVSSDANLGTAPGSATPAQLIISGGALSASASFALNADRGIAVGPTTGAGGGTVDVAGGSTLTYGGIIADNGSGMGTLSKTSGGTLTLSGANTYSGDTHINGGTLALTGSGALVNSSNILIAAGATFDVSGLSGYTLAASQGLQAPGGATATVVGNLDLASASLLMSNVPNTPTITVAGGTLTLGNTMSFTVDLNNGGAGLTAGSYKLIAKGAGGAVGGTAPAAVIVGGDGLAAGATASLSISGGELFLVISGGALTPPVVDSFTMTSSGVVLSFNGPSGQSWKVLSSTNTAQVLADWSVVASGTFSGAPVSYTNAAPVDPQRFYRVASP